MQFDHEAQQYYCTQRNSEHLQLGTNDPEWDFVNSMPIPTPIKYNQLPIYQFVQLSDLHKKTDSTTNETYATNTSFQRRWASEATWLKLHRIQI